MESARHGHYSEIFPRHQIPYKAVNDFVACSPICQKDRLDMAPLDTLPEVMCHDKVPHARHTVGVDVLTITSRDQFGNLTYLEVIVIVHKFCCHAFIG
jgi:hypothetical protein